LYLLPLIKRESDRRLIISLLATYPWSMAGEARMVFWIVEGEANSERICTRISAGRLLKQSMMKMLLRCRRRKPRVGKLWEKRRSGGKKKGHMGSYIY